MTTWPTASAAMPARAMAALTTVVATCYLLGVSTRRMDRLVETLGITSLSKSQVSVMAKELDCPVIALSQLNRASEAREGVPSLADLRESGSIEQDADAVLLLHVPQETGPDGALVPDNTRLVVTIAKNRQGPQGRPLRHLRLDGHGA